MTVSKTNVGIVRGYNFPALFKSRLGLRMHRQIPGSSNIPSAVGGTKHVWIVVVKRRAVQGNSLNVQSASDVKGDAGTQDRVFVPTKLMRGLLNLA